MTEKQWLACTDPQKMLKHLGDKAGDRKLRLFACACCRRAWPALTGSRHAVELAERYADGRASLAKFEEAELSWGDPQVALDVAVQHSLAGYSTLWSSDEDAAEVAGYCAQLAALAAAGPAGLDRAERADQCDLLRCIFGDPTRPIAHPSAWKTPQAVALGRAAYSRRELPAGTLDVARLAILADALEDAGCTDRAILDHLRGPGPHVRGCWAIDLLLGKS